MDRSPFSPLILSIATGGAACSASVHDAEMERGSESIELGRGHAEHIVDVCRTALDRAGATWSDVTHVAVDVGPGSFTGVRAGVAAARGLALSLAVEVVGVSAFSAIASVEPCRPLAVALDLRRGRIAVRTSGADRSLDLGVGSAEDMARRLASLAPMHLRGSAATLLGSSLDRLGHDPLSIEDASASAHGVARAALALLASDDPLPPAVPLYLRAADAAPPAPSPFAASTA